MKALDATLRRSSNRTCSGFRANVVRERDDNSLELEPAPGVVSHVFVDAKKAAESVGRAVRPAHPFDLDNIEWDRRLRAARGHCIGWSGREVHVEGKSLARQDHRPSNGVTPQHLDPPGHHDKLGAEYPARTLYQGSTE